MANPATLEQPDTETPGIDLNSNTGANTCNLSLPIFKVLLLQGREIKSIK